MDSLIPYLHQIDRHGVQSRAEEQRLVRLAAGGDQAAKRRLVESHARLVVAIARGYEGLGLDLSDLVGEGNFGLLSAVDEYDWRRDAEFATYAGRRIGSAIRRAISERSRLTRLPDLRAHSATGEQRARTLVSALSTLRARDGRIMELRYGLDGRPPRSLAQVADELGLSRERVRQVEKRTLYQLRRRPDVQALRPAASPRAA